MADDYRADPATIQLAVAAAIAAAGPAGTSVRNWEDRVMATVPKVAAMIADGSRASELARQVLEAPIIHTVYKSYEMEESSKRAIVTFVRNDAGETETLRTWPQYTALGGATIRILDDLQPGAEVRVWKAIETKKDRADVKVRVIAHLQVVKNTAADGAPPAPPQREGAGTAPVEESPTPDEAPPAPTSEPTTAIEAVRAQLHKLPPAKRDLVVKAFRARGWQTAEAIPAADHELALYMSLHEGEEPF